MPSTSGAPIAPDPSVDAAGGRVTTVVVSRDRRPELLASLARHDGPVVYVDNASSDGSADAVQAALPHVRILRLDRNEGAPARNRGVLLATTPYVAFADDDSWWAPGALTRAADLFDAHPRLGLVAARILLRAAEVEDPICRVMADSPLPDVPGLPGRPVLGFVACAAVVRRDAFLAVGGFDEVVFFPGEEARVALDLASSGWGLAYVRDVVAHHHPSPVRSAPDVRRRQLIRSALLTAVMRRPWPVVARLAIASLRRPGPDRAGVLAALREVRGALRCRRVTRADVERGLRALEGSRVRVR